MPQYVKQKDKYSCGAYAILNTLKWLGKKVTIKELSSIWTISECDSPTDGMPMPCLDFALKKLKISYTHQSGPYMHEVDARLDAGEAMILAYLSGPREGHYSLCIGKEGKRYVLVNDSKNTIISKRSRKTMKKRLRRFRESFAFGYPTGWFIKRQNG